MELTYLGHASFKLKNKDGIVIMDPFDEVTTGLTLGKHSADIITVSHSHPDHSATSKITPADRRDKPFLIDQAGEYELGGISVFGVEAYHDKVEGAERGPNLIYTILMDGVNICHLGDLAHPLTEEQLARIGEVDVLLCPVGGYHALDPKEALAILNQLEPKYFIPMHYNTPLLNQEKFASLHPVTDFLNEYGVAPTPIKKLSLTKDSLPDETEIVIFE